MISGRLATARQLCWISIRNGSVAVDAPSTSSAPETPIKEKISHYVPYPEYVAKQFPDQMVSLNYLIKEADNKRNANFKPHTYDKLLKVLTQKVVTENCSLIPVGSSANALITDSSDLDLVFYPTNENYRTQFLRDFDGNVDFREFFMHVIVNLIQRALREEGIEVVFNTILHRLRIPLIRLELNNGVIIDIQFPSSSQSLRNTHLIKTYTYADERFTQLFLWIKRIFTALEVRNSANGLLSTYHILLLTIHFLQSEQSLSPWPVLPTICKTHPHLVGSAVPIQTIIDSLQSSTPYDLGWESKNKMTVSELAVRFIDYYYNFNPSTTAIFIDRGLTHRRKQNVSVELQLQLIDPYYPRTVCRSTYALKAFMEAVAFIRKKIKIGQMIDTFPEFPEAKLFKEETKWATWRLKAIETEEFNLSRRKEAEQYGITDED